MYYDKSVFSEDDIKSLDTMLEKGKVAIPLNNGFYLASFYLGAGATFFGEEGNEREAGIVLDNDETLAMTNALIDMVQNENLVVSSPSTVMEGSGATPKLSPKISSVCAACQVPQKYALKKVATEARKTLEHFFQKSIYLETFVKVDKDWRSSDKELKNFGYQMD